MIDFHSHIIPELDDGSESVEMSVAMLKQCVENGVTELVSTSHCYPRYSKSIEHFVERRANNFDKLLNEINTKNIEVPKIHLASEVNLITDISNFENLNKLCLPNSKYIMIEMPYGVWKEWMLDSIYKITLKGFKPIMAHIDRFMNDNPLISSLFELDVIYQVNAELFMHNSYAKIADDLLSSGHAHLLGSDMHNTDVRPNNIKKACEKIEKRYGKACVEYFEKNAETVLKGSNIDVLYFEPIKKQTFFGKLLKR